MKVLEDEKGSLKIRMDGYDIGAAQALAEQLLENKEITFAAAVYDHPTKRNPVLHVKGKNLKKEILKAIEAMQEETHAFSEALRKTD